MSRYYYSVILRRPVVGATIWHPTDRVGPFATLSRGAFDSVAEAHEWAALRIGHAGYYVQPYPRAYGVNGDSTIVQDVRRANDPETKVTA